MAGRRSQQSNVDPGQFSSPHGTDNTPDEHLRAAEKAHYKQTLADEKNELIPRRGDNPALADLKARRKAAASANAGANADRHVEVRDANERAPDAERTE
jgi:hypothetical protein